MISNKLGVHDCDFIMYIIRNDMYYTPSRVREHLVLNAAKQTKKSIHALQDSLQDFGHEITAVMLHNCKIQKKLSDVRSRSPKSHLSYAKKG